jgi:3-hydroxy-9,10-secoandrosta-1,3,5(10)-triene-9,17-dione monooxygenase
MLANQIGLASSATELVPLLRQRASRDADAQGLSDDTMSALRRLGVFRLYQPKQWGGTESEPHTYFDVQRALSRGDMSAGWVFSIVAVNAWLVGAMGNLAAGDVWGENHEVMVASALAPGGTAVSTEGGFLLTGHWKYASGIAFCDWTIVTSLVPPENGGRPDPRFFLLSRGDYEVVQAWDSPGLRATASDDLIVKGAFVPTHRTRRVIDCYNIVGPDDAASSSSLYRLPFGQIFANGVAACSLGALEHLIEVILEQAAGNERLFSGRTAENPTAQLACAEAVASLDEMTAILQRNIDTLTNYAQMSSPPPLAMRLQYRFQASRIGQRCAIIAAELLRLTGARGLSNDQPYTKIVADITAARQHIANNYECFGRNWGRALLGATPDFDPFS